MSIRRFLHTNYSNFTNLLHFLWDDNPLKLYDSVQYQKFGYHQKSFVGKLSCGESCLILKFLMEQSNFKDVKVYRNCERDEFGIQDHVFLHYDNKIIDPTHRQFFLDYRLSKINCVYRDQLFNRLSPILVIDDKNITKYASNLLNISKFTYGTPFDDLEELSKKWEFTEDVTQKFNINHYKDKSNMLPFIKFLEENNYVF